MTESRNTVRSARKASSAKRAMFLMMAVAPAAMLSMQVAHASTWSATAASGNWSAPGNWDSVPTTGSAILFTGTSTTQATIDDIASTTVFGGITFDATAGNYSIGGTGPLSPGGDIIDNSVNTQTFTIPVALTANRTLTTATGGAMNFNGVISGTGFGVTISGFGTPVVGTGGQANTSIQPTGGNTTFGAANTYTGVTNINGGNLFIGADNSLGAMAFGNVSTATSASGSVGSLNVTGGNLTVTSLAVQTNNFLTSNTVFSTETVTVGAGKTLTVNGATTIGMTSAYEVSNTTGAVTSATFTGAGNVVINGGASNFAVGVGRTNAASGTDPKAVLDLSGVNSFTYTGTTGQFIVGAGNVLGLATLSNTANTITAAQVRVGDSQAGGEDNNPNTGSGSLLTLGTGTNVINTTTIIIGNDKAGGCIGWASPTSTGTLTIAGLAGGTTTADITMGTFINGASGIPAQLQLAGHNVTVQAGNVTVGILNGTGSGAGTNGTGCITFDTGTFNANKITLGNSNTIGTAAGALANQGTGIFTLGSSTSASTGILTVGTLVLGNRTTGNASGNSVVATLNIFGGTANIGNDVIDGSTTFATGKNNATTLNMTGGTLNLGSHNIGNYTVPINVINLTGGTTNVSGNIAGRNITLNPTVLTSTPTIVLSDGGNLTLQAPLTLTGGGGLKGGGSGNVGTITGGDITLNSGATLAPGSSAVTGTLNMTGNLALNSATANFKLGPTSSDVVNVNGSLTLSGSIPLTITPLGTGPTAGNYTILSYTGTLTGSEVNFALGTNNTRFVYSVVPTATTAGTVQINVSGSGPLALTYIGNGSSNWDLKTTADFSDPSSNPQQFFALDSVTFDDTSTNAAAVNIVGALTPGNVTVSAARDYTFSGTGSIAGSTGLNKSNTGNLTLATNNSYTGTTDIEGGTVIVGSGTSGSLGTGPVTDNSNLSFNRTDSITVANAISGSGNLSVSSGGTVSITGNNSYSGTTTLNSGTTKVKASNGLGVNSGGQVTINAGAALDIGGDTTANDQAGLNFGAKQFSVIGTGPAGAGSIVNTGQSQFYAFNNISLAGDTTFSGFRFDIGRSVAGQLNLNGHTLTINMDAASGSLFGMLGNVTVTSGNIVVNTGGTTIEGNANIQNDGSSTITFNSGTECMFYQTPGASNVTRQMVFMGNNIIGNGNVGAAEIGSPMTLMGNVTMEPMTNGVVNLTGNFPLKLDGNITQSGGNYGITKAGANTQTLAGAVNTWTGPSAINGGTLQFSVNPTTGTNVSTIGSFTGTGGGAMIIDPVVQVTSGGLQTNGPLTVNGSLTVAQATVRNLSKVSSLTVAGTTGAWTGSVNLTNSRLVVEDTTANRAADIAMYKDMVANNGGGTVGIFSTNVLADPTNLALVVSDNAVRMATFSQGSTNFGTGVNNVDANSILITATFKGDFNLDGVVDLKDLQDIANHWQQTVTDWSQGDVDGNGKVELQDLQAVANHWQAGVGAPGAGSGESFGEALSLIGGLGGSGSAVPEPASLALLGVGGGILAMRRRKAR